MMKNRGFTLIELLVTLVIIGIISVIAMQSYEKVTGRSKEEKYVYYRDAMKTAADLLLEGRKKDMVSGSCIAISYQKIVDSGKLKEEGVTCEGSLVLNKTGKKFNYDDGNLECKNENNVSIKKRTKDISGCAIY